MSNRPAAELATHRKVLMLQCGIKGRDVASRLRVHKSLVSRVINGTKRSARVETMLASMLKTPRSSLWPKNS